MLTEITLHGQMGRKFGRTWRFDVATPAEAFRALCSQVEGFKEYLDARRQKAIQVLIGKDDAISKDQLLDPLGGQDLHIIPVIAGAKSDGVQMIIGAVLIVVGVMTEQPWLVNMGVVMMVGGISQWLFSGPNPEDPKEANNGPSYLFNGPVNTTAQGNVVPVGYGKLRVGSAVIYGTLRNEEYSNGGFGATGGGGHITHVTAD